MAELKSSNLTGDLTVTGDITCPTAVESIKSGFCVTGGGTISYISTKYFNWTSRFVIVGNGSGSNYSTSGYFEIECPAVGTTITGVGGASNVTVTSDGILIGNNLSLYYILPIGSTYASNSSNFRIVAGGTTTYNIPNNWLLIAINNGDAGTIRVCTGIILSAGGNNWLSAYNSTSFVSNTPTDTGLEVALYTQVFM